MSLPIVIVFERHWDTIPKSVIKDLLPDLKRRGYETFCFEAPQNLSPAEIVDQHNSGLELDSDIQQQAEKLLKQVGITTKLSEMSFRSLAELLRLYASSKRYVEVAEKIKQLPASRMLKEIFGKATELFMSLKGIDIDSEDFNEMISVDLSKRMSGIRLREDHRITTMVQNLLKLRTQQKEGMIFACGALHAKGLIDEFKKHDLQDEVLYYFPHSSSRYDESIDDIDAVMTDTLGALVDHTYLLAQEDIKPFGKKVIREITEKTRYTREILGYNSHSQFLSDCFKTNFRAFLRPGYHVDALVDVTEPSDIEEIQQRVSTAGVQTHRISLDGRNYLAIPNVNTRDVAERIRKISSE
ncbi:MAG: hypothetical protein WDZ28_00665 [Simkaniaceae bacterium]